MRHDTGNANPTGTENIEVSDPPTTTAQISNEPAASVEPSTAGPTRRALLGAGSRKALYVAPVIFSLAAQQAIASGHAGCGSNFKHTVGSPCATDASGKDCCPPLTCDMDDMSPTYMTCVAP